MNKLKATIKKGKTILLTSIFTALFSLTVFSQSTNSPVFTNFVYEGNDKVYIVERENEGFSVISI